MQAIAQAGGSKTVAAARLGVSRKTIHEYVRAGHASDAHGAAPPV
jgi:transposase